MPQRINRLIKYVLTLWLAVAAALPAQAADSIAPTLVVRKGGIPPQVALTFDLCMGQTDRRIFDFLIAENIPATLFVTGRWLAGNHDVITQIRARPDLFEIGNHGAQHVPALEKIRTVYGLKTAGTLYNICREVEGGEAAIRAAGLEQQYSGWYRGAAALYSSAAIAMIEQHGRRIAGFSRNGDMGASLPAASVARRIGMAKDGDVIIAHMNQPKRQSGAGVAQGIAALKQQGFRFVRLSEGAAPLKPQTTLPPLTCAAYLKDWPSR